MTVVPVGENEHKMGILHLSEDPDSVKQDKERLIRLASDCDNPNNGRVQVVEELMKGAWGTFAASPESYRVLPDAEKQAIRSLMARSSSADAVAKTLAFRPPAPGGRRNRGWVR